MPYVIYVCLEGGGLHLSIALMHFMVGGQSNQDVDSIWKNLVMGSTPMMVTCRGGVNIGNILGLYSPLSTAAVNYLYPEISGTHNQPRMPYDMGGGGILQTTGINTGGRGGNG